jgi:hypothetical protein
MPVLQTVVYTGTEDTASEDQQGPQEIARQLRRQRERRSNHNAPPHEDA